jgi:hypothetical protein
MGVGRKLSVEDAVQWAIDNDVHYIGSQIDLEPERRRYRFAQPSGGSLPGCMALHYGQSRSVVLA